MIDVLIKLWLKFFDWRHKFNGRFFDKKDYSYMRKKKEGGQ